MSAAHHDFETRSACDLKSAGLYRYFEDPTTEILCMSWCIGDGEVFGWRPDDPDPEPLLAHIRNGGTVVAHNAAFERAGWRWLRRHGHAHWPELPVEQQDCTQARGAALALPQSLDGLGAALGSPIQKDQAGYRLMMKLCKPRSVGADGTIVWRDDPAEHARNVAYCVQDTKTERAVDKIVPYLSEAEKRLWILDQRMNERGVCLDIPMVTRALAAVKEAQKRADDKMWRLTEGAVSRCTEVAKIVAWINSKGVPCESVAQEEIEELLLGAQAMGRDDVEEVVALRRASAKGSTSKFKSMLASTCADGRSRGTLNYHGAGPGRWAGRLWQPQNLPRMDEPEEEWPQIECVLRILESTHTAADAVDAIESIVGSALLWLSKALRSMLIAAKGKKFVGGDFSNIEGRISAWIAGEEWKVQAFRDYDAGTGPDLYKLTYAKSFGVDVAKVSKTDRAMGKVQELSLGYAGGVKAFQKAAAKNNARQADKSKHVYATDERADQLKHAWRDAHSNIVAAWKELEDAAIEAVEAPGVIVSCLGGKVRYQCANGFLYCCLPSGRVIAYAGPQVKWTTSDWETPEGKTKKIKKRQIFYWGVDSSKGKKWCEGSLYGGLQFENVAQAIARDVLVDAMFRAEERGFEIVLTVHDELLCEVDDVTRITSYADELRDIMSVVPKWAPGLPIAATTWEGKRYEK